MVMAKQSGVGHLLSTLREHLLPITQAHSAFREGRTKSSFTYIMNQQHWAPELRRTSTQMFSAKVTPGPSGELLIVWNPTYFENMDSSVRPTEWDDFARWVKKDKSPAYTDKNDFSTWHLFLKNETEVHDFIARVKQAYRMPPAA